MQQTTPIGNKSKLRASPLFQRLLTGVFRKPARAKFDTLASIAHVTLATPD